MDLTLQRPFVRKGMFSPLPMNREPGGQERLLTPARSSAEEEREKPPRR